MAAVYEWTIQYNERQWSVNDSNLVSDVIEVYFVRCYA